MKKVNVVLHGSGILTNCHEGNIYVMETGRKDVPFSFTTELEMATAYAIYDVIGYGRAIQWAKEQRKENAGPLADNGHPTLVDAP